MLSNSSVVIATNLAKVITDRSLSLVPKQSTLLLELTNSVKNNMFSNPDKEEYIEPGIVNASTGSVVSSKSVKTYSQSTHDTIMDNYIEDLAELTSKHLSFTRNVVNKEVVKLKESLETTLTNYKYREPEDFFKISYFKLSDVFKSELITSEISSYANSSGNFYCEALSLETLNNPEFDLLKYILTGDESQDKSIVDWFNTVGRDQALSYITTNVAEYSLATNKLLDYSLVNYLFFRNLTEKGEVVIGEGAINLGYSSIALKGKSSGNRDYFGNKLSVAVEAYGKDIRNGRLLTTDSNVMFSYFNNDSLDITIYEESFAVLAEKGVTIDAVFGCISSDNKNDVTVDQIVAKASDYLDKWRNTRSLYLITLNRSKLDIFKQILRQQFEVSIADCTDEEKEVFNTSSRYTEETLALANKYIDELQLSEIDCLDDICLELVAKYRFRFSNAWFLLREMKEIMAMDDKTEPLEAALYSTIRYITDYMLQQISVLKI